MFNNNVWIRKIAKDRLLLLFTALMLILLILRPASLSKLNAYINWPTIIALTGLLIITTGIQQSGLMEQWVAHLIGKLKTRRNLWLVLIAFSTASAMLLTNDIALFLIIPFTLKIHRQTPLKIRPLLIFETIAVNVGSMLTPIGNPQNIYLWQKAHISFTSFVVEMLPAFLLQGALLLIAVLFISSTSAIKPIPATQLQKVNVRLALSSALLLITYLIAYNMELGIYAAGFTVLFFLIYFRTIFLQIDWSLILLFLLLFMDVGILSEFPFLKTITHSFNPSIPSHAVLLGAGYSQLMSNVPATLFLSPYIYHWKYLAWGVNLGANGLLIASFANIITVRLARKKNLWLHYHYYAIPFGLISIALIFLFLS